MDDDDEDSDDSDEEFDSELLSYFSLFLDVLDFLCFSFSCCHEI